MRRISPILMAATLVVAACGGDDDTAAEPAPAADAATERDDEAPEADGDATDDAAGGEISGGEISGGDSTDGTGGGDAATEDGPADSADNDGITIDSLDDIPPQCVELLTDFLHEIEPMVSGIDWTQATPAQFEAVAGDFETLSDDFEDRSAEAGCDDLDVVIDDEGLELVIELAAATAPGSVEFLQFLDDMMSGVADAVADADTEGPSTCADLVALVEEWMDAYDGMSQMPVAELTKFASLGTLLPNCTAEEIAFFDSDEVLEFLEN